MHKSKQIFSRLIVVISVVVFVPLAEAEPKPSGLATASSREILHRLAEGVHKITLPNGLRVVHFKRGEAPVFSAQVWVKVGGVNETAGKTGAAHLLEHMAFKGTTKIGTSDWGKEKILLEQCEKLAQEVETNRSPETADRLKQVNTELESIWRSNEFGLLYQQRGAVGLNAATSKDYTMYMVSLPTTELEFWAWMESERLRDPVFRQFYKERSVVQEEMRSRVEDDPDGKIYQALLATAYWAHPNRLPVIGWPDDVANLHTRDVEKLYKTYYRPDNIVIGLVGDFDLKDVQPVVERYFGRLPKEDSPLPKVVTKEMPQHGERRSVVKFDAQPRFTMAFHKPVYPNRDDLYFSVIHSLLSDGRSSILYRELVQEKKLAVSVASTEAPGELYPSLFVVEVVPAAGVSNERLIVEVQRILDRLKEKQVAAKDLEAAKKRVRVDLLGTLSSSYKLSSALAHAELLWGDWQVLFEMYDIVLATTAEDVQRLARTYLNVENRTVITLEKQEPSEVKLQ